MVKYRLLTYYCLVLALWAYLASVTDGTRNTVVLINSPRTSSWSRKADTNGSLRLSMFPHMVKIDLLTFIQKPINQRT
jgi:hypothetical protein